MANPNSNRAKAEAHCYKGLDLIDPSGASTKLKKEQYALLSDEQFKAHMESVRDGKDFISITVPNLTKNRAVCIKNNLKVAPKFGVEFFQQVWMTDNKSGVRFLTPHKYLVVDLPVRRQIQTLESKIALADNNKKIDDMTNQVTRESAKSSLSFPEVLVMVASGQYRAIEELMKVRGGDLAAQNNANSNIFATGGFSLDTVAKLGSRAKATETLSVLLTAMHFDNNF